MFLIAILLAAAPALAPLTSTSGNPLAKGTAGVQFVLPGGGAPTVGVTYFLADNMAARVDFGLDAVLSPSGTPATFSIDLGLRFYQQRHGPVALFLQPAFAFGRELVGPLGDAAEFLSFGAGAGVEYFFTDHLSAGGILGAALRLGNLGGPAGSSVVTRLSTATSGLFANFYF